MGKKKGQKKGPKETTEESPPGSHEQQVAQPVPPAEGVAAPARQVQQTGIEQQYQQRETTSQRQMPESRRPQQQRMKAGQPKGGPTASMSASDTSESPSVFSSEKGAVPKQRKQRGQEKGYRATAAEPRPSRYEQQDFRPVQSSTWSRTPQAQGQQTERQQPQRKEQETLVQQQTHEAWRPQQQQQQHQQQKRQQQQQHHHQRQQRQQEQRQQEQYQQEQLQQEQPQEQRQQQQRQQKHQQQQHQQEQHQQERQQEQRQQEQRQQEQRQQEQQHQQEQQQRQQQQLVKASQPKHSPSTPASVSDTSRSSSVSILSSGKGAAPKRGKKDGKEKSPMSDLSKAVEQLQPPSGFHRHGTAGRPIQVWTNHLTLDLSGMVKKKIIHYDVDIVPDKPKRLLKYVMEEYRRKHYPSQNPSFDGRKNLYSVGLLPVGEEHSSTIQLVESEGKKPRDYTVKVKFAKVVDMSTLGKYLHGNGRQSVSPQEAKQAVEIVLQSAGNLNCLQVGRSVFSRDPRFVGDLQEGLEVWTGLYRSAVLGWDMYVNVDVAHKAFPKAQPVTKLISEVCWNANLDRALQPRQKDDLYRYLKGLNIEYVIPGQPESRKTYRVNGLGGSASSERFLKDGKRITVYQYFYEDKGYKLRYPEMPCLQVGPLTRDTPILLPLELCSVAEGQISMKMTDRAKDKMIRYTATDTFVRYQKIMNLLQKVNFNGSASVKEFGVRVGDDFEMINARVLSPPDVQYKAHQKVGVSNGEWRATKFIDGKGLHRWTVVRLACEAREDSLRKFISMMQAEGRNLDMDVTPPQQDLRVIDKVVFFRDVRELPAFLHSCVKNKLQLVVVVVPDFGDTYSRVKQIAELEVGIMTQCIKMKTMEKIYPPTVRNILLKVNSKLNGINHTVLTGPAQSRMISDAMFVGADVTHPSPDQYDEPSIAAVTASFEPLAFRYRVQFRFQQPREEIIQDMVNIMKQHLLFYKQQNGSFPKRVIYYRDGVSEGQMPTLLATEFQAIRRACSDVSQGYNPLVTFMVVQKRHHTRFFPQERDEHGKGKNVPPGTIVDTQITHPREVDFYLVSHASIQGVARPTKYRCLWDDSGMTEDEMEKLTYDLCHLFSRCTRTVSYPAPTYYAHRMAYRARAYIKGKKIVLNNLENEQRRHTIREVVQSDSPMFFV